MAADAERALEHDDDAQPELVGQLRELLQSPGWQWLTRVAAEEYGPAGYGRKINAAVSQIAAGPDRPYEIAKATEQIHESCEAVNALMKRPKGEIDRLTKKPSQRPFDRFRRTVETHR